MLDVKTRGDLQKLVDDKVPESLTLEYKASNALGRENDQRTELVKDVTAFANSAGGQIIYGIAEQREAEGVSYSLDDGVDSTRISPEWIDQVIASNASPRLQGLRIVPVPLEATNRVAYVLTIPQATSFAPHQNTYDQKYYRRSEGRSTAMYDYEIRDVLRRATTPDLWIDLSFPNGKSTTFNFPLQGSASQPIWLNATIRNRSKEPSLYTIIKIFVDLKFTALRPSPGIDELRELSGIHNVDGHQLKTYVIDWIAPNKMPIFAEAVFNVTRFPLIFTLDQMDINSPSFWIGYEILAPGFSTAKFFRVEHQPKMTLRIIDGPGE
jgi:hypothetical protein